MGTDSRCFEVVRDKNERYFTVSSVIVAIKGSWWTIKHKDGSITKENGGGNWCKTIKEAWCTTITRQSSLVCRYSRSWAVENHEKNRDAKYLKWFSAEKQLNNMVCDMFEEVYAFGKLEGQLSKIIEINKKKRK
jgi:hypothetical protein